jgi:hypothetical protein
MLRNILSLLVVALLIAPLTSTMADTLLLEGVQAGQASQDARPRRGMTMDSVQAKWGQPVSQRAAVGEPPIARWEYPDFIVFFEYQRVIHAVRKN